MTDAGVIAIAENCKSLTHLDIQYCPKVTDAGVIAIAENCKSLSKLCLNSCDQVTDAGRKIVFQKFPNCDIRR